MNKYLKILQKEKNELLNLKEALLMIKFLTVPDPEIELSKGKVLTLFKKTKTR